MTRSQLTRRFQPAKVLRPREFRPPIFPALKHLDVEVGCGVGWHPIRYATENPDRVLVAIEHTKTRFQAFERRIENHRELGNLLPIHADAIAWITHALLPETVDQFIFLYPNPYPKKKDRNRRWHAMPFMEHLISTLKPGGEILLATNERFYFEEAREFWLEVWGMEFVAERSFSQTSAEMAPRTHFEKKYLSRGESCFELRVRRPAITQRM